MQRIASMNREVQSLNAYEKNLDLQIQKWEELKMEKEAAILEAEKLLLLFLLKR